MSLTRWWNTLSRKERARWLAAHHIKTSIAMYTWHCLAQHEQRQVENERNLELAMAG